MTRSSAGIDLSTAAVTSRSCSFGSSGKFASTIFIAVKLTRRSLTETFVSDSSLMVPIDGLSPVFGRYDTALNATMCFC